MSARLVDLHCHILPGIDDGAKNMEITKQLMRKELEDGVAGIMFTPHFHYERTTVEQFAAKRAAAFAQVARWVNSERLPIAGKQGAEVYFSTALPSLDLSRLTFAGTNYLLIEFPTTFHPAGIEDTLFAIQQQGYIPIIAHVERYPYVTDDPTLLYRWVSAGALAQINGSALIHDGHTAKLLKKYIDWNLVHLLCTDAHSPIHRPPNLRQAMDTLPTRDAERLCKNAVEVFLGNELPAEEPKEPRYVLGRWV